MQNKVAKLFLKLFLLIFPFIAVLGYIEFRLYQIPNQHNQKRSFFEDQLDSIEVLALGPSYTMYGVNPDYFSCKGFNLGDHSQSLFYDTQITLRYLDKLENLKCVLVTVAYFSLSFQMHDIGEEWRDCSYSYFWNIRYPEISKYDIRNYSLIRFYTVDSTVKYMKQNFKVDLSENLHRSGWLKVDTIEKNYSNESGKYTVDFHNGILKKNKFVEIIQMLDHFVKKCKQRNIEVVFMTLPVLPTYYKYVNQGYYSRNTRIVNYLCKKYDCKYYNYFTDGRFVKSDFKNDDHLNYRGAEKFSKIINHDIISKICVSKNRQSLK